MATKKALVSIQKGAVRSASPAGTDRGGASPALPRSGRGAQDEGVQGHGHGAEDRREHDERGPPAVGVDEGL